MTSRKKTVSRQKTGGRKRETSTSVRPARAPSKSISTSTERQHTKMRAELLKIKQDEYMEVTKFLEKYDEGKQIYNLGQKEWSSDPNIKKLASADVDTYREWHNSPKNAKLKTRIDDAYNELEQHSYRDATYQCQRIAWAKMRAEAVSRFIDSRHPYWDNRRLAWFCEELTDRNLHIESGYIGLVHMGRIPLDIYWEAILKQGGV